MNSPWSHQAPLDYAPDYAPPEDEPYQPTSLANALTSAVYAVVIGLACYGAWALVWF